MPVYTVHEPPLKAGETAANPDRFVFVRDGFAFWAFLMTPLWLLAKRLWLVLLLYAVAMIAVTLLLRLAGVAPGARFFVLALVSLLVGLEAASLQRWTLGRRKWKQTSTVIADDEEAAESRFFAQWVARRAAPQSVADAAPVSAFVAPVINPPRPQSHPLGLFPEPRK